MSFVKTGDAIPITHIFVEGEKIDETVKEKMELLKQQMEAAETPDTKKAD